MNGFYFIFIMVFLITGILSILIINVTITKISDWRFCCWIRKNEKDYFDKRRRGEDMGQGLGGFHNVLMDPQTCREIDPETGKTFKFDKTGKLYSN